MTFYPIIVIYNEKCSDSPSCTKLIELGHPPIIADNSTADMGNAEYCSEHGMHYISMGGNAGLPMAYNRVIDYVMAIADGNEAESYIVWFDDDTLISDNYFSDIISGEGKIFAPVVRSIGTERIISPCVINPKKCGEFRPLNGDEIPSLQTVHSAINSGLCVNLSVYREYRYEENMFLDFVDHDFAQTMLDCGIEMRPSYDVTLMQNFSSDTRQSIKNRLARNRLFRKDYLYYASKWGIPYLVAHKRLFNRKVSLLLKR